MDDSMSVATEQLSPTAIAIRAIQREAIDSIRQQFAGDVQQMKEAIDRISMDWHWYIPSDQFHKGRGEADLRDSITAAETLIERIRLSYEHD